MESMYSPEESCKANHTPYPQQEHPPAPARSSINTSPLKTLRQRSNPAIAYAIQHAEAQEGGGVVVTLKARDVSGKVLKESLQAMFPAPQEYSVQLRRDRYRVTLPNHSKDDIQGYFSM